jgi:hypothetical protein
VLIVLKSGSLSLLDPQGLSRPVMGLLYLFIYSESWLFLFSHILYILESNPHSVFGDFLNGNMLVCGSNPYLSFNRPLPTGRLLE